MIRVHLLSEKNKKAIYFERYKKKLSVKDDECIPYVSMNNNTTRIHIRL